MQKKKRQTKKDAHFPQEDKRKASEHINLSRAISGDSGTTAEQ